MPHPTVDLPALREILKDHPGWLDEAVDTAEASRITGFAAALAGFIAAVAAYRQLHTKLGISAEVLIKPSRRSRAT
jgi:hypothetical protein